MATFEGKNAVCPFLITKISAGQQRLFAKLLCSANLRPFTRFDLCADARTV